MKLAAGWRRLRLGDIAMVRDGAHITPDYLNEGVPFLRVCDIATKEVDLSSVKRISQEEYEKLTKTVRPQRGDILLSKNGTIGLPKVVDWDWPFACFVSLALLRIKNTEMVSANYLYEVLKSPLVQREIGLRAKAGTVTNLHLEEIKEIQIPLPGTEQQTELVDCARKWQSGIDILEDLGEEARHLKRGLMQQLLTGRTRFKEFEGEQWRNLLLGDVLTYVPRLIKKPEGAFLAAGIRSHGKGVFLKPDFEAQDIALDELFQLRTDDLVVNITFGWEGAVAIVPPEANGALVSHRFPTFTFKEGVSFPDYFRHVIRQKRFVHEMGLASPGGAGRNRVLSKSGFLCIPVEIPSLEEQRRIASALNACDSEIELLQNQLAALKEQKRGLMQKLLAGQIQVNV